MVLVNVIILLCIVLTLYICLILQNEPFLDKMSKEPTISIEINGRQCHDSVRMLYNLCDVSKPKIYCEIGVHNGTSMSYAASNKNVKKCIGIDLFEDTVGHYKKDNLTLNNSLQNVNNNKLRNGNHECNITLIKGDSTHDTTRKKLADELNGESIDILFIDGDHSYEGVRSDFENYKSYVNGYVVFDDYNKKWPGVVQFVDELVKSGSVESIGLVHDNEYIIKI